VKKKKNFLVFETVSSNNNQAPERRTGIVLIDRVSSKECVWKCDIGTAHNAYSLW